ncbi:MAG: Methyltransferase corrinoid activation protein [uncultured Thermoleophilia bacterium]|uniref:Methyltransferase corrinoid activation protein n=1 Tax=uncultured Thermoleophilia bacterium TaxID=1497501 RepID=A0A6J4U4H4_9ACTN|nr:MAG: Methyltransferase corrinoid activation protein [uncultured Thermoleophilia bacterium]
MTDKVSGVDPNVTLATVAAEEDDGRSPNGSADGGLGRVHLRFRPSGEEVRVPPGVTVFDAASWNGIAIDSTCGGHGTCKKCGVRVLEGEMPVTRLDARAFSPDQLRDGWRLACRARTAGDLVLDVPPLQSRPKAATVGVGRQVILRPAVQKRYVELEEPTLSDQATDVDRLVGAIEDLELRVGLPVLRTLGTTLRRHDFKVTAVIVDEELIDVEPGDTTGRRFGIAFDLGTTTVVATLLDLATGTPLAVRSTLNLQQPFGADVISRISATMLDETALDRLRELAQTTLDGLAAEVCEAGGVEPREVYEVAMAGNATMTHLALGIDPEPLGVAPFVMSSPSFPGLKASDLGVHVHPAAPALAFPALGAYVGGDIVAGLLATGMTRDRRLRLFIDVGTNCEIALGSAERVVTTAAPAGPAFEAAQIRCGMRAADGAVEVVRIKGDELTVGVIGDTEPVGLCGSGLVDACAELNRAGLLDGSGRFVSDEVARSVSEPLAERLTAIGEERVFVLHWREDADGTRRPAVYLSQRDVRELQFAKASIATGWRLLVEELGIEVADIQQVLLGGSFGTYLSPSSAVRIGLVPKLPVTRIVSAGNVAGEGAKMALLSVQERHAAAQMLTDVEYVELSDRPDFNDRFVGELAFPG